MKQYGNAVELLEQLTAGDRSNAQYRVDLADALSSTARLYVSMGAGEPAMRLQYWTKARSFYERSQELWLVLERTGKIPPARRGVIREVRDGLARCDDSIAKLEH
jgi:hypothetical protein